ncbi:MAG: restriction endonuclease subunit S [Chromatiaceae bacterium]
MADEWESAPLSELCEQIADCPHSTPLWTDGGVIVLRNQNIRDGRLDLSSPSYTDEAHFEQRSRRAKLKAGDLVLTREAPMGEVCMVPENLRCCLGQRMVMLRPDPKKCDSRFLLYSIQSDAVQHEIKVNEGTGSTVSNLRIPLLEALPIPHPPIPEQKAIAEVLGPLDDKIELNRRMNATLEAMARALFQSWFVDFDPVRAKLDGRPPAALDPATAALFPEHLEDSPLGHIPKGWTAGRLGDIGTNSRRGVQPRDIAPNTPYIALEHMPRRCIALGDWADSADVASGKCAFKKGEILFGKLRPYFHKVGVAPFDGVCSTDILVLAPKSPAWFGFLLGHASSDELIQFTDLASTGTKMPRTNWSDISSFKVALPPKPIAAAFTRNIQPMLDRIHGNLHQSRTLATLRDTLLPKLLSGELSVTEVEKEVPA